jgi:outer membrane protein assembly factor BamD
MAFRLLTAIVCAAVLMSGCSWFETHDNRPAPDLAQAGMEAYRIGRYNEAIEIFTQLKDWYPFSKYAMLAELKIADAHYELEEYEEAILAYEEFESLHPRNEATPYTVYRIGLCYFEQVDTPDRDQSTAAKALETFIRLGKQYPQSDYVIRAQEHIQKCYRSLAASEFSIGKHYYKTKHYRGALSRFKSVVANYPDAGVHFQALQYIARSEAKLGPGAPAADAAPNKEKDFEESVVDPKGEPVTADPSDQEQP